MKLAHDELMQVAKGLTAPNLRTGNVEEQLAQLCEFVGCEYSSFPPMQMQLEVWHKFYVEAGLGELMQEDEMTVTLFLLLCMKQTQEKANPTAMDKYQAGARIVNERRAAVREEFKQQKENVQCD